MIAHVKGTVAVTGKDFVVVDVGGVGFQVFVPRILIDDLAGTEQEVTLFTYLHVRENELTLYGCGSQDELAIFRLLLGVTGIGPKVALSLLSSLPPDQLRTAIAQGDETALARVPGIGPKTAKKLVFDLKDKVTAGAPVREPVPVLTADDADLIAALTSLGYSVAEAQEALRSLPHTPMSLEERVRLALAFFIS
jgi:Holliday junction DNA helicase RuvA